MQRLPLADPFALRAAAPAAHAWTGRVESQRAFPIPLVFPFH